MLPASLLGEKPDVVTGDSGGERSGDTRTWFFMEHFKLPGSIVRSFLTRNAKFELLSREALIHRIVPRCYAAPMFVVVGQTARCR